MAMAAMLALPVAATSAQPPAAVHSDWSRTVVATPEGGFRMGNPDAAVKVVEFVSLTCPHCRSFAQTGAPALVRDYVRTGRVSFEIRPFPLDVVASLAAQLNRCAAPAEAFALNDDILTSQDQWFARLDGLSEQEIRAIETLAPAEQRQRIASAIGLDAIAARHGVDAGASRACLADQAGAERVERIKAEGEALGVQGTPSFLINGRLAPHVHDWAALEPLLRPAG